MAKTNKKKEAMVEENIGVDFDAIREECIEEAKVDGEAVAVVIDENTTKIPLTVPAVVIEGMVDCSDCIGCKHADSMRRNPRESGGMGLCPRLKVKAEKEQPKQEEQASQDAIVQAAVSAIDEFQAAELGKLRKYEDCITKEIGTICKSFCKIGFYLWKIKEDDLYLLSDCKNVYDYGQLYFNFKRASVANYIRVCEHFSKRDKDGNPTAVLDENFRNFTYSQLTEMASLPESMVPEIKPEMTVKEIKGLKSGKAAQTESQEGPEEAECPSGSVAESEFTPPQKYEELIWNGQLTEGNLNKLLAKLKDSFGLRLEVVVKYD